MHKTRAQKRATLKCLIAGGRNKQGGLVAIEEINKRGPEYAGV